MELLDRDAEIVRDGFCGKFLFVVAVDVIYKRVGNAAFLDLADVLDFLVGVAVFADFDPIRAAKTLEMCDSST